MVTQAKVTKVISVPDLISELAQKLYMDNHGGNLYHEPASTVTHYEEMAIETIEREG